MQQRSKNRWKIRRKESDEKQRRTEMTKRTVEKAQETPKNTQGGMLDCAWMLLLATY